MLIPAIPFVKATKEDALKPNDRWRMHFVGVGLHWVLVPFRSV